MFQEAAIALFDGRLLATAMASAVTAFAAAGTEDCNGNGVPDARDIASGTSGDCDANGVPDECGGFLLTASEEFWASDPQEDDQFGFAVAISGNVAVSTAPYDDDHGAGFGSLYVHRFNGTDWQQEAEIAIPHGGSPFTMNAVAVSGDTVVVGVSVGG